MELYQLNSFLTVARISNLTRAAAELCISQSALSSQLKALESELGIRLFRRTTRGMELTDPGRIMLTYAQDVADAALSLQKKANFLSGQGKASITIGLNADPNFLKVSAINRSLLSLSPDLNLIFLTSQTAKTPQMLRQERIDAGFIYGEAHEADLRSAIVTMVKIQTVIPRNFLRDDMQLDFREVSRLPWIWVDQDCLFYEIMGGKMAAISLEPNRKVVTTDEQIVKELAAAGQGVAMIRADEAEALLIQEKVVNWPQGELSIPLSLIWLTKNDRESYIKEILEAIVQEFK